MRACGDWDSQGACDRDGGRAVGSVGKGLTHSISKCKVGTTSMEPPGFYVSCRSTRPSDERVYHLVAFSTPRSGHSLLRRLRCRL
jgi:hypothetical protein